MRCVAWPPGAALTDHEQRRAGAVGQSLCHLREYDRAPSEERDNQVGDDVEDIDPKGND
jgi:hypothetical protein